MTMNILNSKRAQQYILFTLLLVSGASLISCDRSILAGEIDDSSYKLANEVQTYLKDASSSWESVRAELRTESAIQIQVVVTSATKTATTVQISAEESYVELYNVENTSTYEPFPVENVTIADNGNISIAPWQKESAVSTVTLKRGTLEDGTYLLPLVIKQSDLEIVAGKEVVYYFVKVTSTPDITKYSVQNGLPLAHLAYTVTDCYNVGLFVLEESRKPLFDYAVLFCINIAGINWETGEVEITYGDIEPVLRNPEKFIRPLQDRGIKVLLGILGGFGVNIGLANMQGDQMKHFAAQIKVIVDTFGLDGIDLDDEYVSYPTSIVAPELYPEWEASAQKMGRLIIELRRVMPDKIISLYEYGSYLGSSLSANNPVDGYIMRDITDMARYPMYGGNQSRTTSTMGFPNDRYSPVAFWIDQNGGWTETQMRNYLTGSTWINGGYSHLFHYNVYADDRLVDYFNQYVPIVYGENVVLESPFVPYPE